MDEKETFSLQVGTNGCISVTFDDEPTFRAFVTACYNWRVPYAAHPASLSVTYQDRKNSDAWERECGGFR